MHLPWQHLIFWDENLQHGKVKLLVTTTKIKNKNQRNIFIGKKT
jgi:hypothetical protein